MVRWIGSFYARRIVNVNVNIVLAGFVAMGLTLIPVHYSRDLGIESKFAIVAIALGFDIFFDVAVYYALHWVANHWKAIRPAGARQPRLSFFHDASLVQFERALLAPLYYGVKAGVMTLALHSGIEREWALVYGYCIGIATTRTLHTLWLLRQERRWRRQDELAARGDEALYAQPGDDTGPPPLDANEPPDRPEPAGDSPAHAPVPAGMKRSTTGGQHSSDD